MLSTQLLCHLTIKAKEDTKKDELRKAEVQAVNTNNLNEMRYVELVDCPGRTCSLAERLDPLGYDRLLQANRLIKMQRL